MNNDVFSVMLNKLYNLNLQDIYALQSIEQEAVLQLKQNPENVKGLIVLLKVEIMLGKSQKARAIANRIWSIGNKPEQELELNYIDSLLNLGLLEMASLLIKDHFINLQKDVNIYYPVLLKFAIMTGNVNLIEKILTYQDNKVIRDFIDVYKIQKYTEHFKHIQKIIIEEVKDIICIYNFNFYKDRGFSDLELVLYVESDNVDKIWQNIDTKLDFYHLTNKVKRLHTLSFLVRDVNNR